MKKKKQMNGDDVIGIDNNGECQHDSQVPTDVERVNGISEGDSHETVSSDHDEIHVVRVDDAQQCGQSM